MAEVSARGKTRERITGTLAKRILSGEISPGERLPTEVELGQALGVSRTALREAVRTLAGKGLVEARTRSGTIVLPKANWNHLDPDLLEWREELAPDLEFIRGLTEARQVIEPGAAEFAARRATGQDLGRIAASYEAMCAADPLDIEASVQADESFHVAILQASHNPVFMNFGALIGSALRSAFRLTTAASDNYAKTLRSHGDVLEAIRLRRPEEARRQMAELLAIASHDVHRLVLQRETVP